MVVEVVVEVVRGCGGGGDVGTGEEQLRST